jgi:WD40-like Beta Propeller Repeat
VFDSKTTNPTVSAAKATAGTVMSSDGVTAFKAEYAAEPNGWACPDGYTGEPQSNWPCLADPISAGASGIGNQHGRGMSQWGSQRWAIGKSYVGALTAKAAWPCILDHYYNDNGNNTGAGTDARTMLINGPGGGSRVAFDAQESTGRVDLYSMKIDGSIPISRLTLPKQADAAPTWSPNRDKIAFARREVSGSGGWEVFVMKADGSNQTQLTSTGVAVEKPTLSKFAEISSHQDAL